MFKKLKSLFVIEEEIEPKSKSVSAKKETKSSRPQAPVTEEIPPIISARKAEIDDKSLKVLFRAMEENDLDGFDYLEFKEFLRSLDKVQMDEATRFRSAFATAQTMGASVQVLKDSAKHYLAVLRSEEEKFQQAFKARRQQIVEKRQKAINDLEAMIRNKEKQIQTWTADIAKHKEQMSEMQSAIDSSRAKVETTKNNFLHTYNTLVKQIKEDVNKIETHLQ